MFHQRIYAVTLLTAQQPFRSVTTVARLLHVSSCCIRRCSSPTSALHSLLKTPVTTSSIWRMMNSHHSHHTHGSDRLSSAYHHNDNTNNHVAIKLYTAKAELEVRYPIPQVEHLLRLRDMVTWSIANPDMKDRQFVDELRSRYGLSQVTAYADLKIVKALLPNLSECTRDFHRWRYNEMIMETYQMAKKRKDTKTMEKAATSYAKFNRIDIEDEQSVPYHMIVVQPFFPTTDPRVVGITPVPNIDDRIRKLTQELTTTHPDTENIEYEQADLVLDDIFKPEDNEQQS